MSDNHRRYSSKLKTLPSTEVGAHIRKELSQMYAKEPKGYTVKQLNVLAALISGIVGSRRTNYPQIGMCQ